MRKTTSMKKIRELLRLAHEGLSQRKAATCACISRTVAQEILSKASLHKLIWPLDVTYTDEVLHDILFPKNIIKNSTDKKIPDWAEVQKELLKKGLTLKLLWTEYKEECPDGYQYSKYCEMFRQWKKSTRLSMRQNHVAGEKMFIDFSGVTVEYIDRGTGEIKRAEIFLSVLGGSSYTFAYAVPNQTIPSWIDAHIKAFDFFGGISQILIPDNLKSGVKKPCRYEPDLNPTYRDFAQHYGVAVIPARVRKPKDKSKVEVAVQVAERWILAVLRKHKFYSVFEINEAIVPLLKIMNDKVMKHIGSSRKELYEKYEKPVLKKLPNEPFEIYFWKKVNVNIDYHVEFEKHYYSVPHTLIHKEVEIRVTKDVVEIYHSDKKVIIHKRSSLLGKHTTIPEHMPSQHKKHAEWTPERMISWAESIGPCVKECFDIIINKCDHPEQGFRSCLGILRLGKSYSNKRLEDACLRAITYGHVSYKTVKNILANNLDKISLPKKEEESPNLHHENIRGADYYH